MEIMPAKKGWELGKLGPAGGGLFKLKSTKMLYTCHR
jgi:hypothetical protein